MDADTDLPAEVPDTGCQHDVGGTGAPPDEAGAAPAAPRRRVKLVVTLDPAGAEARGVSARFVFVGEKRSPRARKLVIWNTPSTTPVRVE
jgi:hypothetical protein